MKKIATLALVGALAVSACSKTPGAIAPVPMGNTFAATDCHTVTAQLNAERTKLQELSGKQRAAAAADAVGVFLLLVPVGKVVGGDNEGEIGASKGKVIALEARAQQCGLPV